MAATDAAPAESLYARLDEARASALHRLTVLTAGMGFFADAYDLFIIGTVTSLLTPLWHLTTNQLSLLNSISLLASVAGALVFGRLMDRAGRKAMYGLEVSLLAVAALASAFAWSFGALLVCRLLVGFGVGGDYATSAVISSEFANRRDRGRMVGSVFAMQGFGLLAGPAVASVLLATGLSHALDWRLMLGLGAIPAASVIYLRRRIRETPRFTLDVRGDVAATAETVALLTGGRPPAVAAAPLAARPRRRLTDPPLLLRLVGTAGCWFLLDMAFYGNSVSSPLILRSLQPAGSLLQHTLLAGLIFLVAALPGYWLAVALIDRIGRRRIQWMGYLVMAGCFGAIALVPAVIAHAWVFLALFAVSYFFTECGPNMTTFVYPAEVFPTELRGAGDGISAAAGKLGAFCGALLVPHLLQAFGLGHVMGVMAGASACGLALTLVALHEPRGLSLEEASASVQPRRADPQSAGRAAYAGGGR